MILKHSLLYISFIFIMMSCQGTDGEIQRYKTSKSMKYVETSILSLDNDYVSVFNNTDFSGINRPGYMDIRLNKDKSIRYKIAFYGNEEEWKRASNCMFSVIKINGKINSQFSFFSSEKKELISIFDTEVIPLLEKEVGKIKKGE